MTTLTSGAEVSLTDRSLLALEMCDMHRHASAATNRHSAQNTRTGPHRRGQMPGDLRRMCANAIHTCKIRVGRPRGLVGRLQLPVVTPGVERFDVGGVGVALEAEGRRVARERAAG